MKVYGVWQNRKRKPHHNQGRFSQKHKVDLTVKKISRFTKFYLEKIPNTCRYPCCSRWDGRASHALQAEETWWLAAKEQHRAEGLITAAMGQEGPRSTGRFPETHNPIRPWEKVQTSAGCKISYRVPASTCLDCQGHGTQGKTDAVTGQSHAKHVAHGTGSRTQRGH